MFCEIANSLTPSGKIWVFVETVFDSFEKIRRDLNERQPNIGQAQPACQRHCPDAYAALLIGSTFAWFTSTATTNVSNVTAGTLKVEIVNTDGSELENNIVNFVDKNGSSNILREPGVTFTTKEFKIQNAGNLAPKCKFQLGMNVTDANKALYNAITFYIAYKDATGTEETDKGILYVVKEL